MAGSPGETVAPYLTIWIEWCLSSALRIMRLACRVAVSVLQLNFDFAVSCGSWNQVVFDLQVVPVDGGLDWLSLVLVFCALAFLGGPRPLCYTEQATQAWHAKEAKSTTFLGSMRCWTCCEQIIVHLGIVDVGVSRIMI